MGKVADIVAVKDEKVWVIECKCSFGLQVLAQADYWRHYADYLSIATPSRNHGRLDSRVVTFLNMGWIETEHGCEWRNEDKYVAKEIIKAVHVPRQGEYIKNCLRKQHKDWAKAGNADGKKFSSFQYTKQMMIDYLKKNPRSDMKTIVKNINHHYHSDNAAIGSLRQWINKGIIPEVNCDMEGKKNVYWVRETK